MRILFVISILAFIALLWATVAIVQHVRRQRRRQRRFLESNGTLAVQSTAAPLGITGLPSKTSIPLLTFTDPAAPPPPLPPPPVPGPVAEVQQEPEASVADELPVETEGATSEPEVIQLADESPTTAASPEPEIAPVAEVQPAVEPEPESEITLAIEEHLEAESYTAPETIPEVQPHHEPDFTPEPEITAAAEEQLESEPASEPDTLSVEPEPAPEPEATQSTIPEPPPLVRPIRSGPPKHPLAQLVQPLPRPDWAYFNKDMGDLSDPEPRSNGRPKLRTLKPTSRT